MASIKQVASGEYYLCARRTGKVGRFTQHKNLFLVKHTKGCGEVVIGRSMISVPKGLIGKRIRLKVEVEE